MKTSKLTLLLILFMGVTFVFGQDYAFKVLINKGSNEIKSGEAWQPVKTGASLKPEDELKISENSYIGLVHVSGKPMEIKQSGNYKIVDLSAKVSGGTSALSKYTDFILSNNSAEAKKNRLNATGAVHRGEVSAIQLRLPENQYSGIYNHIAIISWEGTKVPGPYTVTLRNMFDDELAQIETPETAFSIDLNDAKFSTENAILVEVRSKTDSKQVSKQHLIKRLAPAEQQNVKKALDAIVNEVNESTALNKLILAHFYEENKLYIDAITAYEEAIALAPDVPAYKDSYDEFLLRQNIRKP